MNKKILSFILMGIFCGSIVLGAWYFGFTESAFYTILSIEKGFSITTSLSGGNLNTTDSTAIFNDTIVITNDDGVMPLNISINETRMDVADGCNDYLGDVDIDYFFARQGYGSYPLTNGDIITLEQGISTIYINIEAEKLSCPQDITIEIEGMII